MISHIRLMLVPTVLCLALAACDRAETEAAATPEVAGASAFAERGTAGNVVEVSGMNYAFNAPLEIASGWTTFRFTNQGPEPHHLSLVRLENGHSVEDLMNALRDRKPLTGIATAVGGPNAPMPGGVSNATLDLEPGEYAMLCVIPSPDGVPHFAKGMVKPITVRDDAAPSAAEPAADAQITLKDYSFEFSEQGEVRPGLRTIRVTNEATAREPHEVVLARLAPGKTAADFDHWLHSVDGPPPGEILGGVTALDPGQSNTFTADLVPGEYVIACPLPSVMDGQPHSLKGMIQQFSVR